MSRNGKKAQKANDVASRENNLQYEYVHATLEAREVEPECDDIVRDFLEEKGYRVDKRVYQLGPVSVQYSVIHSSDNASDLQLRFTGNNQQSLDNVVNGVKNKLSTVFGEPHQKHS